MSQEVSPGYVECRVKPTLPRTFESRFLLHLTILNVENWKFSLLNKNPQGSSLFRSKKIVRKLPIFLYLSILSATILLKHAVYLALDVHFSPRMLTYI